MLGQLIDPKLCTKLDSGSWKVPHQWYDIARGDRGVGTQRLGRAELLVKGSTRFYRHHCWRLFRNRAPAQRALIQMIDCLPPALGARLLEGPPAPSVGRRVRLLLDDNDLMAICEHAATDEDLTSLHALDALAALLATILLLSMANPHDWRLARVEHYAHRLFHHVTSDVPFVHRAYELWELAYPRFFAQVADREYRSWCADAGAIEDLLAVSEGLGLVGKHPGQRRRLLLEAEKFTFAHIANEAAQYSTEFSTTKQVPPMDPALAAFVAHMSALNGAEPLKTFTISDSMTKALKERERRRNEEENS
jgi:hypothetical protein